MERASGNYAFVRRVFEIKRTNVRNYPFVRRVIEMERANIRNYAFVRRVIEMKRASGNYSFAESFACIQM